MDNNIICVFTVINLDTKESEIIAYATNYTPPEASQTRDIFLAQLPEGKNFDLNFEFFSTDWSISDVVWEAMNFAME